MNLHLLEDRVQVVPRNFPTNRGGLCQKGWNAAALLDHPERLTVPLMRTSRHKPLQPVSWEQALERIGQLIQTLQIESGPQALGVFGGGGLTNETAYLLGKFARVALRTPNIDYNGRFCMAAAATANNMVFGLDRGLPFPIADIAHTDVILLVGGNLAETMPPVMQYFVAQRHNGGKLIVVDPRQTPTAASADLHLQLTPGSDAALANGLLYIAIRDQLIDQEFIQQRTHGFAAVQQAVATYWPERVEQLTGIPTQQLTAAAHWLGQAPTAMILSARGAEQQQQGVANVLALTNLALALGKAGKPYCGYGCLTGQGNGQGGREHGQKADQLPGYRHLANQADRELVAAHWGVTPASLPEPGVSAYELLDTLGTPAGVRGLLVFGSNPAVSAPNALHVRQRLQALDLLVVTDLFLSETAELADVVLPTTQWAEEPGTMTNLEGRVLLRQQVRPPPNGVRSDTAIIAAIANYLGYSAQFPSDPATIFAELSAITAGSRADYSGISYARIQAENGVFWPCPHPEHPGTSHLFLDRFATSDGCARFYPVQYQPPAEVPDPEYPFFLTTGRIMAHYQSGTQTRRVAALNTARSTAFVEIHPAMAANLGINDGEIVRVVSRRGEALLAARLTTTIRLDTLFAPFHWGDQSSINRLTNPALDPLAKIPEFKVCAVRVERLQPLSNQR
jgi:assimilatory nitrate reductase catalytic subunit